MLQPYTPWSSAQSYGTGPGYVGPPEFGFVFAAAAEPTAPEDWEDQVTGVWNCEEAAGVDLDNAEGTAANDLTDHDGTIARDTTNFIEGSQSCDYPGGSGKYHKCSSGTCHTVPLHTDGDWTTICWVRPTDGSGIMRYMDSFTGTSGVQHTRQTSSSGYYRGVFASGCNDNSPASSAALNTWAHVANVYVDDTSLTHYKDGTSSGSPDTSCTTAEQDGTDFRLSSSSGAWIGQLDGCLVDDAVWDADEICRHGSCGARGEFCACDTATPANYAGCSSNSDCDITGDSIQRVCDTTNSTCSGHNNGRMGGCTLTDCNDAGP
jgi:hypothetical protein